MTRPRTYKSSPDAREHAARIRRQNPSTANALDAASAEFTRSDADRQEANDPGNSGSTVTVEHGYGDPRLQRISKLITTPSPRYVLDTYLAMIELRLAGYDAFEVGGWANNPKQLWYRTTLPGNANSDSGYERNLVGKGPARRVYGPNNTVALIDRAASNPDAKLAPTVTTERRQRNGQPCPACQCNTLTVDGEWGLGVTLPNGYTPAKGELVLYAMRLRL